MSVSGKERLSNLLYQIICFLLRPQVEVMTLYIVVSFQMKSLPRMIRELTAACLFSIEPNRSLVIINIDTAQKQN